MAGAVGSRKGGSRVVKMIAKRPSTTSRFLKTVESGSWAAVYLTMQGELAIVLGRGAFSDITLSGWLGCCWLLGWQELLNVDGLQGLAQKGSNIRLRCR